jgi:hypothetical protein
MLYHIGQRVVCISEEFSKAAYWREVARVLPQLKRIYTIRGICEDDGLVGFYLEEILNPKGHFRSGYDEPAFNIKNFRPLKETSIEVFKKMLEPVKSDAKREAVNVD